MENDLYNNKKLKNVKYIISHGKLNIYNNKNV